MIQPPKLSKENAEELICSDALLALTQCRIRLNNVQKSYDEISHLIVASAYKIAWVYHEERQDADDFLNFKRWPESPKRPTTIEGWQLLILRYIHGAWGTDGDFKKLYTRANTQRRALRSLGSDELSFDDVLSALDAKGIKARADETSRPRTSPKVYARTRIREQKVQSKADDIAAVGGNQATHQMVDLTRTLIIRLSHDRLNEILEIPDGCRITLKVTFNGKKKNHRICELRALSYPDNVGALAKQPRRT